MKIALIGFGVENQAAYRYLSAQGHQITVCKRTDTNDIPSGVELRFGTSYLDKLDEFDLIVRTSGVHPRLILDKNPGVQSKITTAINLFFENCQTPIIGITGTKGKGTTSTLVAKILEAAGKKVVLAGNIGIPALDMLDRANQSDYAVLELSSFQLYDCRYSPQTAVCLMVVPEHLNWHDNLQDYTEAKANLFRHQNSDDVAIYNALNPSSKQIAEVSPSSHKLAYAVAPKGEDTGRPDASAYVINDTIYYNDTEIAKIAEVALLGRHNLENICAAIAATWEITGGDTEAVRSVITTFSGLEFRLEFICEVQGVKYYNDSFSTTPETAIAAMRAFEQPKILILGGSDKGIPFDQLALEVTKNNVKHVLAIGDVGSKIAILLQKNGFSNVIQDNLTSMQSIVGTAASLAETGDIVLLSTGAASFGLFKDYKDRGKQFNQAVQALA